MSADVTNSLINPLQQSSNVPDLSTSKSHNMALGTSNDWPVKRAIVDLPCSEATFSRYAVCGGLQMSYTGTRPIKRSCDRVTNLVKYYLMLSGNESRPKGTHSESKAFRARHGSAEKKKRLFRPQSLLSAVFRSIRQYFARLIRRSNDGLLDSTVQKQR